MTSRERFRATINHQEPDRVPIDIGQDHHNGLHEVAYRNLLTYLNDSDEIIIWDQMQHLALVKDSILNRLKVDTRYYFANPGEGFSLEIEDDSSWLDEWGVRRKTIGYYDENVVAPLANITGSKLGEYQVPNPEDPARFQGVGDKARSLWDDTDFAVVCGDACSLFFLSSELTGFQEYMEKLLTDQNLIVRLIDKVLDWQMKYFSNLLDEVGDLTEVVWMGDDWGTQLGPIINPKMFREIFVPRYKDFISMVKSKTSAKVALHSCGSVFWALDDLVSAGVEIIHPLQGDAEGMTDPYEINRRFGDQLVFYSNLRNQSVIPHGTASEVEQDVLEKIRALAPGGGLIMSGGHNIQADVPPENLISLVESVVKHGVYPLDS